MFRIIAILCLSLACTASFAQRCGTAGQPPCPPDPVTALQNAVSSLQSAVTALQTEVQALQAGAGAKVFSFSASRVPIPGKTPDSIVGTLGPIPAGRYLLTARALLYSPQTDTVVWICHLDADLAGNGSFTTVDLFFVDLQKDPGAANNGEVVLMTDAVFTNPGKVVMYCGEFFGGGPGAEVDAVYLIAQQIL